MCESIDITGMMEEELVGLNRRIEELKALVALRADELERLRSAAALEKHEAMKELTEGLCHEILNPLAVVLLVLHKFEDEEEVAPGVLERLKTIEEQALRIDDIIKSLVLFCRNGAPERRPVDLNEKLRSFLAREEEGLCSRKIEVELKLEESLPEISLDAEQLEQVISHLIENAGDAMPDGGRLVVSTGLVSERGRIFATLRVEDTGYGISPETEKRLFEPFYTTKPEGRGKGLGLAVCRGIVEAHGGSVEVETIEGRGAAFTIRLPL